MDPLSAYSVTGLTPVAPSSNTAKPTEAIAVSGGHPPIWSPQNPLFWFGVVLAAALGLIGTTGSVRVGPAKVSASLGGGT